MTIEFFMWTIESTTFGRLEECGKGDDDLMFATRRMKKSGRNGDTWKIQEENWKNDHAKERWT